MRFSQEIQPGDSARRFRQRSRLIQAKKKNTAVSFFSYCNHLLFTYCYCYGRGQNWAVETACKAGWLCRFFRLRAPGSFGSVRNPVKASIQL